MMKCCAQNSYACTTTYEFNAILALRFVLKTLKLLSRFVSFSFNGHENALGGRPKDHFQNDDALCLKTSFQGKRLKYKQFAYFQAKQLMLTVFVLYRDSFFLKIESISNSEMAYQVLCTSIFSIQYFKLKFTGLLYLRTSLLSRHF